MRAGRKITRMSALSLVLGATLAFTPSLRAQWAPSDPGDTGAAASAVRAASQPGAPEFRTWPATKTAVTPPADRRPVPAANAAGDPPAKSGGGDPQWEAFLGYSYLNASIGNGISRYNGNGGSGSIAFNLNRWLGVVADLGGYHTGTINNVSLDLNQFTYLFGPRLNYRFGENDRHTIFGQALFGGDRSSGSFAGISGSENTFALAIGGGFDAGLTDHIAWRVGQVEYLMTRFNIPSYHTQSNFRFSTGILFRWGTTGH